MPRHAEAPSFRGEGKIVFVDREYADPGPGELLVRVNANAICGTDREQFYAGSEVTPGHEAAGTVELAGRGNCHCRRNSAVLCTSWTTADSAAAASLATPTNA